MKKSSLLDKILACEIDPAFSRRARTILENINPLPNQKILEIGCGRGFYLKACSLLYPKTKIWGIDKNPSYLKTAKNFINNKKVKLIQADATRLPFAEKSFEFVIASEVLEHIDNDQKAIAEIYRVLKPNGTLIITVPNQNYPFLWDPLNWILERLFRTHVPAHIWWLAGIWADHHRLYTKKELEKKIRKTGLVIEKLQYATRWCFPFSHFLLYGIGKNLVESKIVPKSIKKDFNRFSNKKFDNLLLKIIQKIFNLFDRLNQDEEKRSTSVNIIIQATRNSS